MSPSVSGEKRRTDSPGLNSMGMEADSSMGTRLNTSRFTLSSSSGGFSLSSGTGLGSTALVPVGRLPPGCLAITPDIRCAMSFTVRASINSSKSIVIPNWRSAASMMMGRRLERTERSFLRSISGLISSLSNPVASMMIRISLSISFWWTGASSKAGETFPMIAGAGSRGADSDGRNVGAGAMT